MIFLSSEAHLALNTLKNRQLMQKKILRENEEKTSAFGTRIVHSAL